MPSNHPPSNGPQPDPDESLDPSRGSRSRRKPVARVAPPVDPEQGGQAAPLDQVGLQAENQALRDRLALLEEKLALVADGTRRASREAPYTDSNAGSSPEAMALAWMQALGDTLPCAAYVCDLREDDLVYGNGHLDRALGYEKGQLTRLLRAALVHPEDRPLRTGALAVLAEKADGEVVESTLRLRHRDGRWLRFLFRDRVLQRDAAGNVQLLSGSAQNLTIQKATEDALEMQVALYRSALQHMPEACLLLFDRHGVIRLAEGHCTEQMGSSSEDLLGRRVGDASLPGYAGRVPADRYRSVLRGDSQTLELHDGRKVYEMQLLPVFDSEGHVAGGLQVMRDVSDRAQAESELENRVVELAQTNRELQGYIASNLELEQFAYVAAHDLKEPIRTITSFAQLLARHLGDSLDSNAKDYLVYIQDGALRMDALIRGLLEYSQVQQKGAADFERVDLAESVEGVFHGLATQIEERHVQVIYGNLPIISGDPVQLGQLFQNLVSNAIKFNTGENPEVRIEGTPQGDNWHFTVADNGIGIPAEGREKVFGIFRRLHDRDTFEGAGIGLAVCKKIVERHGGRIWFDSEEGRGTTFHFTVPRLVRG